MQRLANRYYRLRDTLAGPLRLLDGLPPLALRLYLAPVLWMAGTQKLAAMDSTVEWFGNSEWAEHAPGLKTLDDALDLRRRILLAYERAEWPASTERAG